MLDARGRVRGPLIAGQTNLAGPSRWVSSARFGRLTLACRAIFPLQDERVGLDDPEREEQRSPDPRPWLGSAAGGDERAPSPAAMNGVVRGCAS